WGTFRMAINLQTSSACEDVSEVSQGRFWELVPGHAVGCFSSSDLGKTMFHDNLSSLVDTLWYSDD
uniref:Uncharacterized protein n=1 Tax=Aegilops tauschii subsp. strangulata TaxID=200361 RepID=A0A453T4U8_AEGTS